MRDLLTLLYHDLRMHFREAFSVVTPLLFFIIVVCLFPFALDSNSLLLEKIAPGIIWVAALLSILISMGNLFKLEMEEGSLDLLLLSPYSLSLLVFFKIMSHWLTYTLPLVLISPFLGILLHLRPQEEIVLFATLLLGTPVLTMIGAIGSALTIGIRYGSLLLPILIMPLYIPILIFGAGTVMTAHLHLAIAGYFAIMGALLLFCFAFAPFFTGVALRIGANQ